MSDLISAFILWADTPGQHEAYLTKLHPLLIMLIGIAVGLFLALILAAHFFLRQKKQAQQQISEVTGYFQTERLQTESILEDLGLGVMAYSPDGRLRVANKAMRELLGEAVPERLDDFLSKYGEENGLKAQALLGSAVARAELKLGKKTIALQLRESSEPDIGVIAKIVVAQDITREREEEQRRKVFVANVSHELKTPLTIIKTYSESLLDWGIDEKSPDAVKNDLNRILDDVNRMEALIEDLLLLSTLDSRGKALRMQETDMAVLVRQIVERCQLQAKEKEIRLSCYVMSSLPNAFIDRNAIERVLMNIIQNAIKFTDKNGRIDVFVTKIWQDIVVKIKDNGQGIDPVHQKDIFERFYRVNNTGSRKYGGTGLGLAIAKELTELHHGKITLNSALTRGSEFSVVLPSAAKIYRKVMLSLVQAQTDDSDDALIREAEAELLQQAAELGMKAKSLQDLTRAQREELLAPYKSEPDEEDEDEYAAEDFAGILSGDKTAAETKSASAAKPAAEKPADPRSGDRSENERRPAAEEPERLAEPLRAAAEKEQVKTAAGVASADESRCSEKPAADQPKEPGAESAPAETE